MKQKIHYRVFSFLLAVLMLGSCLVPANAATFQYDPAAAVAYAAANWDTDDGTVCDQFVKNCLHAGGVTIRAGGVDEVKNALVDAGFGTLTKITVTQDGSGHITAADNPGVKAGDVLFFYCHGCAMSTHVVLIAGFDANGNMQTYGHNPSWNLVDWMANFKHGNDDGTWHDVFDFYVVKMDTSTKDHQHDFGITVPTDLTSNLRYEQEHPHKFYDQCSTCSAKYYLGWNATTTNCYICNPSPAGIPVLTVEVTEVNGSPAMKLTWTAIEGVYTYEILRAKGDSATFFSLDSVDAGSYTNKTGEAGVTYRYKIKAGEVESAVVTVTWPGDLAAPVLQGTLSEDGEVQLSWTDNSSPSGYEVHRKASNENAFSKVYENTGKTYKSRNVHGGMTYVYKVRSVYADGSYSPFSNEVSITVPAEAPVLSDATTDPNKPSLSWTGLYDASKYEVYRREAGGTFGKIYTIAAKTYTNTSVERGKTYEYKVRAVYTDGTYSDFSNVVTITVPGDEPPEAPVLTDNGLSGAGKPKLKWNAVANAVKYRVYRQKEGTAYWSTYTISALTYTHISAVAGKTYTYQVCAVYEDGTEGPRSEAVTVQVPGQQLPAAPSLTANGLTSTGNPKLKWSQASGALRYRVYRRMEGAAKWTTYTINSLTYTHISVVPGKTYSYQVCAVYADGSEGPRSNTVTIRVPGGGLPVILVLSVNGQTSDGAAVLAWTEAADAVRYCLYRRAEGTSNWSLYTVNAQPYASVPVVEGTSYEYQVSAMYANGQESARSNTVTVESTSEEQSSALELTANGRNAAGNPKLKWTEVKGAMRYRVYRLKEGTSKWTSYTIGYLTYTHLSAEAGKIYEYKVCPIFADGTEGAFSNTVTIQAGNPG